MPAITTAFGARTRATKPSRTVATNGAAAMYARTPKVCRALLSNFWRS
jgi:hypothetical protein